MLFSNLLSKLRGSRKGSKRYRQPKRLSRQLELEGLEQREVPTVAFTPVFGAETIFWSANSQSVTSPITNNPTVLNNPAVYLIFMGTNWTNTNAGKLASDAQTIIGSQYLSGLKQYGSDGLATYGGYTIDNRAAPAANVADAGAEIQYILDNQMTSWAKPTGLAANPPGGASNVGSTSYLKSPIYVVVFDNGGNSANNGGGFYSSSVLGIKLWYLTNVIKINVNGSNEDQFTDLFSHELVERISDGTGLGIKMKAPVNLTGEYQNAQISDNEPDGGRYTSRLNGKVLVQAYWSILDQAFIIPDANQQKVLQDPVWEGKNFTGKFVSLQQDHLYKISGTSQTLIDTNVVSYATDSGGAVFYLTASGQVREYSWPANTSTAITGANTSATALVAADGGIYMLASNNGGPKQVWYYQEYAFIPYWVAETGTNTSVTQIAAAGDGQYLHNSLFMLANNGGPNQVWEYSGSGTNWTAVTGTNTNVREIDTAGNLLYMLANNGGPNQVWEYSGSGGNWTAVTGTSTNVAEVAASPTVLYMLASNNGGPEQVWQYDLTPNVWTALTGTNTNVGKIVTAGIDLYMQAYNNGGPNQVWQYSGPGTSWIALTGTNTNVVTISATGDCLYMYASNNGGPYYWWQYDGTPGQWTIL